MVKKIGIICVGLLMAIQGLRAQTDIIVHDGQTGKDEAIDLPEGMMQETDSLLKEWYAKTYLMMGDSCESSSENPVFDKEVYISRLSRLPNVIEMPYNDIVRQFIDHYCTKLRGSVSYMLGANNFYVQIFEEALESYQLPIELKYLPIIESGLKPDARSHAGAAGLWQFMIGTGKLYGLEVNSLVDERLDPVKASFAAARYLKDLYKIFGDWTLVIAAYNCGPGNVNKAITRAGNKRDYWQIYPYLPKETRGYVPAFIAANYVMNYYCEHNICPMNSTLPAYTDTIYVNRDVHFNQITAMCNVKPDEVEALNPQYRTGLIPGSKQPSILRLPVHGINAFLSAGDSVYNYKSDELINTRSVVEAAKPTAKPAQSTRKTITVRRGDTLSTIAKRNGTTVSKIRKLNGLKGSSIRAGQKLRVR